MRNSVNYLEQLYTFIESAKVSVEEDSSNPAIGFSDIACFPKEKGLYIIYYMDTMVYIGCAHEDKRTIYKRCKQYKSRTDTGNHLKGKIEDIFNVNSDEAMRIIEQDLFVKFVCLGELNSREIRNLEKYSILAYKPPFNYY